MAALALWMGVMVAMWRAAPGQVQVSQLLRLMPDLLRLLKRLATDACLPLRVRVRLWLLLGYLALPLDLVPDFVPVIGYADDVIIVMVVVRGVARRVGSCALKRQWPGTAQGFVALSGLLGLPASPPDSSRQAHDSP